MIDEASSKIRIKKYIEPDEIKKLQEELEKIEKDKEDAIYNQEFENAAKLRDKEREVKIKLSQSSSEWEKYKIRDIVEVKDQPLDHRNMFVLAVATSIDALAVGITFAFLDTPILEAITIIGITTMIISIVGVVIGNYFGGKYKHKAELVGGIILVLLGVRILIQHLSGLA